MTNQAKIWHALEADTDAAAREAVEYALMEAGALGTYCHDKGQDILVVTGYFDAPLDHELINAEITYALRLYDLPPDSVSAQRAGEVPNQDWLAEWKRNWRAVTAGCFYIAPPWEDEPKNKSLVVIRIEPGMAFGTGTHETTKLCLSAIEKYYAGGSFLDVGTGTGILSIAAAKLFPQEQFDACDTDGDSIIIARENAELNQTPQVNFQVGTLDETFGRYDFVVANLTADVIAPLLPALKAVTGGRLVLSGILATQEEFIREQLRAAGVEEPLETTRDGEWIALVLGSQASCLPRTPPGVSQP
jgi:ribosomal protein L11 methyltransferase